MNAKNQIEINKSAIDCEDDFDRLFIRGVLGVLWPDFGRSVNPISTRGTGYAHLITTGNLGWSDPPTALLIKHIMLYFVFSRHIYRHVLINDFFSSRYFCPAWISLNL